MRAAVPGNHIRILVGLLGVVLLTFPMNTMARDTLSGRFYITYQNFDRARGRQEYLSEQFETTLRDRLFERNDLAVTFYLDNSRDLVLNQTVRRYRGMLDLQNPFYSFNARFTPRQEISALEQVAAVEYEDKQMQLDVHVPDIPRVRLSYGRNERFVQGFGGNRTTDLRGDLFYTYNIFTMGLNRWFTRSENSAKRETTVTGADLRAAKSYGPLFTFDAGYQYQMSEVRPSIGRNQDIANSSFTGLFTSRYHRAVQGALTLNRRYLTNESNTTFKSTDDNDRLSALFFPLSPVNVELSDTYVRAMQDTLVSKTNYGTVQMLADGNVWWRTRGLLQLTRQFDIDTINGIVPDHMYIARLESFDRRGVDLRAEAAVSERVDEDTRAYRYRNTSLFDIYLRPWKDVTVVPRAQFTNFGDVITFTGNDQANYGLNATWNARAVNLGTNLTHSVVTSGRESVSNAAAVNVSASMRNRSSLSVSYAIRETDQFGTSTLPEQYDKSHTLNVWGQVWVLPRGSLSVNYTHVDRERLSDTNYVALNYRQEF